MTKKRDNPFYFNELFDSGILANLSPADALVYLAYVRYTNGGDDSAFPSQEKLSKNLGIAIRTIRRAIKKLSDLGYIKQVSSGKGKNSNKSNVFDVIMPSQLGFSKSATQAPVPPATVPAPVHQTQPAPVAAPASTPTVTAPQTLIHKTPGGITALEVYDLAKKKGYSRIAAFKSAKDFDDYIYLVGNLEIEIGNEKLENFWQEVNAA